MLWVALAAALVLADLVGGVWIVLRDHGDRMSPPSDRALAMAEGYRLRETIYAPDGCIPCRVDAVRPLRSGVWFLRVTGRAHARCFTIDLATARSAQRVDFPGVTAVSCTRQSSARPS